MNKPFPFDALRRRPDVETENLYAHDATDRLLLDTADVQPEGFRPGEVAVVGDTHGALTLGIAHAGAAGIRSHQDPVTGELALAANAAALGLNHLYSSRPLDAGLFEGARLVLMQLPRSLDALEEIAWHIAAVASPDVVVLAGGRVKHMTPAMSEVLAGYFGSVAAGLARQKSRVLTASRPLPGKKSKFPLEAAYDVGLPQLLQLRAFGATYGGAKLDPGTRFLLPHLANARPATSAIDLGCGNGTIATYLALTRPGLKVTATDSSAAAVAATGATVRANGVAGVVDVVRDDGLSRQPDRSAELIVLNPPFHSGHTVHAGIALKLFADAGRTLAPGGELWTVWNSHLQYRGALERLVGPTRQVARNSKFTVTVSTRD